MNMMKEEYETVKDLFSRYAYTYGYEFHEVNITLSVTVHHEGHDLSFMYIYGNRKMFVVDEFDPMQTMNVVTNIRSLPDRMTDKIAEWKGKIHGTC
jgi:hypothetical protein